MGFSNSGMQATSVTGPKLAATVVKLLCATGRNGVGAMILTGAVTSDTLCSVTNLTDGGANITDDFSTVGTGTLTQTTATDYSAKMLLVQLRPAS